VWSLASAAVGLANSFWQVLLFRLILGAGQAVAQPASLTYIRRNFQVHEQGMATGIYLSGLMVGPAAGMYFGAVLMEQLGWRSMFVLTGLLPCIWVLPWFMLAPRSAGNRPMVSRGAGSVSMKQIFAMRPVWGITIGAFFYAYYWYFVITWLPSYLRMARGFSVMDMGVFTAVPLIAMAVISPLGGRWADHWIAKTGRPLLVRKVFVCAGFMLGSSAVLLLIVDSPAAIMAVLVISLMGLGIATANYWALTQAISPGSLIGRAIGYQNTIGNLAGIAAPIITGLLVGESRNFQSSILFACASLWVAAAAFYWLVTEREVLRLKAGLGDDEVVAE
jgi:MFS family permease